MIKPLETSIEHDRQSASVPLWCTALLAASLLLSSLSVLAGFPDISVQVDRLDYGAYSVQGVNVEMSGQGRAVVSARAMINNRGDEIARSLSLDCPDWEGNEKTRCPGGAWSFDIGPMEDSVNVSGVFGLVSWRGSAIVLTSSLLAAGFEASLDMNSREGFNARLQWSNQAVTGLRDVPGAPPEMDWFKRGDIKGEVRLSAPAAAQPGGKWAINYALESEDLSFDSEDGRFAGESLRIKAAGTFTDGEPFSGTLSGSILGGEILLDDFYRHFGDSALEFETRPVWHEAALDLAGLRVSDGDSLLFKGRLVLPFGDAQTAPSFEVDHLELKFPLAYERYLESMASIRNLDGLTVTGSLSWSGKGSSGFLRSGLLQVSDLTVVDREQGRFAISGLNASLKPGDHDFDSRLAWTGLLIKRINLGPGDIALESEPGKISLAEPLELTVLGGRLSVHELGVLLPRVQSGSEENQRSEPDLSVRASLEGLDMELLTKAMDWPLFTGEISGNIPAVSLKNGVIAVDGEIDISVFDGRLSLTGLSIERPFGVLPSLAANVQASGLDLEQLTSTFSFGQISGRLEGHILDLRMLDWKPVAFDAWFGTPESQTGSNRISRQAVNRLTTISGGSATTALSGPLLRIFNKFSYRRLGLGCQLQNNICDVRGLDDNDASVLIMEGSGIPKVMIRAFNRRMDWPQLVSGLVAASGDKSIRVGD